MIVQIHFAVPAADFNDVNVSLIIYFYILSNIIEEKGK